MLKTISSRLLGKYRLLTAMDVRVRRPKAYLNWVRSNYELKRGLAVVRAKPTKLTIDPTNVCQLRCPLCPTGQRVQDRSKGHAEFEMVKRLIEEVGDSLFFIDFFNWGEPLLNPRTEDLLLLASQKRIISSMSTNLSLPLTDERIERLVTSGLNELVVAADGISPETYGTYRRQGKIDLVLDNLRRILAARTRLGQTTPMITWQFLVFSFNEHERGRVSELATELGVDRLEFRTPFLQTDRFPVPEADRQQIASWQSSDPLYQIQAANPAQTKTYARCGWHYMSAAINWDGTVTPCCTTFEVRDDFGTMGRNGEQASYMEVTNNATYQAVRNRFAGRGGPVASICEKCPTPMIMDYNEFLNRQVVLVTLVALVNEVKRLFRPRRTAATVTPLARSHASQV